MDFGTQGPRGLHAPADLAWLRGVDAYTMGAYAQAEEEFRKAVRLDPGMADGWLGLHALRVGHRARPCCACTATGGGSASSAPGTAAR